MLAGFVARALADPKGIGHFDGRMVCHGVGPYYTTEHPIHPRIAIALFVICSILHALWTIFGALTCVCLCWQ